MLSIQAFNHLLQRDTERPFKAYPRPPPSIPTTPLYPSFSSPSFQTPHSLPHNLSSETSKRRNELAALSPNSSAAYPVAMDFRHSMTQSYDHNLMHEMNSGGPHGRMPNLDPSCQVKSEMDAMACTTSMPSHGLSQGAHGYPSGTMHSMRPGLTPHNVMPGPSNGTEAGSSLGSAHASKPSPPASATLGSSSGGDSPSLPGGDSSPGHGGMGSKMPPKKRPLSVPEDLKDQGYWEKRKKNNESAKRSREARRMKEEQIAMRVVYLEQENLQLKTELSILKTEIDKLRCMCYSS